MAKKDKTRSVPPRRLTNEDMESGLVAVRNCKFFGTVFASGDDFPGKSETGLPKVRITRSRAQDLYDRGFITSRRALGDVERAMRPEPKISPTPKKAAGDDGDD